ncbi:hypothetical protein SAMN04488056_1307 [Cohaesibacter marisflavi]|uniref:Uncharacterized protein n=1 Tax=Cohaesibacter marisflavi TaxID=655353 RepID=A0A1I5NFC8_9HYPH|nr:hypothetical protein SAMN04488056_1307 [Cohaesibacter marisflavi]
MKNKIKTEQAHSKILREIMHFCEGIETANNTVYISTEIPTTLYKKAKSLIGDL